MELQTQNNNGGRSQTSNPNNEEIDSQGLYDDFDSTCSTPYVSAPSSPGRPPISGFFYSAPASPMHFITASVHSSSYENSAAAASSVPLGHEFEFSARFGSTGSANFSSMSSADELFLNGQIRPMKLSSHLERPQVLAPLLDLEGEEEEEDVEIAESHVRGRDLRLRDKSVRRRTRSMSPLRNTPSEWVENNEDELSSVEKKTDKEGSLEIEENEREKIDGLGCSEATPSSSRSSSAGRSSKRWVFLKDFLYRSKSEGRSNNKFWSTISFSPIKDKKPNNHQDPQSKEKACSSNSEAQKSKVKKVSGRPTNGVGKRRVPDFNLFISALDYSFQILS